MKTIDFQGIITLDRPLVEQLKSYLREKETQVSLSILHAIHTLPRERLPSALPYDAQGQIKLADAVEAFSKKIHKIGTSKPFSVSPDDWEMATRQINNSLWEYAEVLESCVSELFLQLQQIGFEQWKPELMNVVNNIKTMLNHRLDDLIWKIKRTEELLWEYRLSCEAHEGRYISLRKLLFFWKSLLDRSLISFLNKSRSFLNIRYQWFRQRFNDYLKLNLRVQESAYKFKGYQVFKLLETRVQQGIQHLYELLKLWELNAKVKSLPAREPICALRNAFSMEKSMSLFIEYYEALRNTLFDMSRKFKYDPKEIYSDEANRKTVGDRLHGFREELHTLGVTVAKYREFFLRTHPSPYVRTRWGFVEWVASPEPRQTKELLHFVYQIEYLDKLFLDLIEALKKGPSAYDNKSLTQYFNDAQRILHEIGQPLTSRNMIRVRTSRLLQLLQQMDELGSFNPDIVGDVAKIMAKALRADWQYNVIFDSTLFHQLYEIHQKILGEVDDRQHMNRMNKFLRMIEDVKDWVKTNNTLSHFKEIGVDISDMKGYLQDFLAFSQRFTSELQDRGDAVLRIESMANQLLEYRYLFGRFFHELHQHGIEGKMIRNQFLFVDQYFEAVENKLQELRHNWE
ncbi:MAG TPA: hypothetical protein VIH61_03590 [Waddliaceae bacterium]